MKHSPPIRTESKEITLASPSAFIIVLHKYHDVLTSAAGRNKTGQRVPISYRHTLTGIKWAFQSHFCSCVSLFSHCLALDVFTSYYLSLKCTENPASPLSVSLLQFVKQLQKSLQTALCQLLIYAFDKDTFLIRLRGHRLIFLIIDHFSRIQMALCYQKSSTQEDKRTD